MTAANGNGNGKRKGTTRAGCNLKLTPALTRRICGHLERGHYIASACAAEGITDRSYRAWRERGNEARVLVDQAKPVPAKDQPFLAFADAVDLARAKGEHWLVEMALTAAEAKQRQWQCYVTILERSRPDRWRKAQRVEHGTPGGQPFPLRIDLGKLSAAELDSLQALLATASPESG